MQVTAAPSVDESPSASWGAVFALSLCAFGLVASEFMPVSLLTPIAQDLGVTEGQAGQAIAVSGAFAVLTSLSISSVAGGLDRKTLLLALTALTIVSGAVVAAAPNYVVFMIGRALIGVALGGFWSMSAATAMRLVPSDQVPKALAIFNGGNALATVVAAPLGSFLGGLIGWRGAFFFVVPVAVIVLIWQVLSLPSMRADARSGKGSVFRLLRQPMVALGMAAAAFFFMGQFTLFTYLRPFLETVTHVDVPTLSVMLLVMGVSGFVGTLLIGGLLTKGLYRTLGLIPALMAVLSLALMTLGGWTGATGVMLGAWGLLATSAPVGWWTWLARALPDDAETGGGLMVAIVQLAITAGATVGGVLYDADGYQATFTASAAMLVAAAVLVVFTSRSSACPRRSPK
ncbi:MULTISPECIES: MFS transporter [Methylopilaceae]|uniref:MFS transporter n=1 Tax=Hansschlegelia zhihuaiae TaxID=405005 RepID=A0A4Q0MAW9_9HYPH|nr:MFS transporter [Hansschlegelia zhihuaiae]RXF69959.1 MFS transporter [Hansschlegelia zhihuaiae]